MKTGFGEASTAFTGPTQIARYDTELWASTWMYCPNCGNPRLSQFEANRPVADFYCAECGEQFELKSQARRFGRRFANGAYSAKMDRLASDSAPHLMLLHYDREDRAVRNMEIVPKSFFTQSIVERRAPLKPTARRAGWVGSNILLDRIPASGRISIIRDGAIRRQERVLEDWNRTRFVGERSGSARGWLLDVMHCVELHGSQEFLLQDIYRYEAYLSSLYPNNSNVRPKVRQQLQVLRDNGFIEFLGGGRYRRK